jgi:hypothetical protein
MKRCGIVSEYGIEGRDRKRRVEVEYPLESGVMSHEEETCT